MSHLYWALALAFNYELSKHVLCSTSPRWTCFIHSYRSYQGIREKTQRSWVKFPLESMFFAEFICSKPLLPTLPTFTIYYIRTFVNRQNNVTESSLKTLIFSRYAFLSDLLVVKIQVVTMKHNIHKETKQICTKLYKEYLITFVVKM